MLEAANPGLWGNGLRARVELISGKFLDDTAKELKVPPSQLFNLIVRDTATGETEVFRNVTVVESARKVDDIINKQSHLVRVPVAGVPTQAPTKSADPQPGDDIWNEKATNQCSTPVEAKAIGDQPLGDDDFIGAGKEGAKKGLYALTNADLFNLLCIPPHSRNTDVGNPLIEQAIALCNERRAMFLIDPPKDWKEEKDVIDALKPTARATIGSPDKNAAIFFPRLSQPDPDPQREGQLDDFAPCGAVAGVFARTDTTRGVWKAPAGMDATLMGVPAAQRGCSTIPRMAS